SVVQAVLAPLPELDPFRFYAKASPERRAVDRTAFKSRLDLVHSAFKLLPVANLFSFRRGPFAHLAAPGAGLKIFFWFFGRRLLNHAFDSDLTVKRVPIERQGHMGIAHHLAALAALVICEEDETALVAALQEHDPRGHAPVGRSGGKRHGFGVGLFGAHGFIEPLFKLSDRVAGDLAFIEGLRDVFAAQARYLSRYIFHAFRAGRT